MMFDIKVLIFSLGLMAIASPSDPNESHVDFFDKEHLDGEWHGRCDDFKDWYTIELDTSTNETYLSARSQNDDCMIIKKIEVDLFEYPYLNWRWRVSQLPPNGDESVKKYCDVGASLAIAFNRSRLAPKSIKYSWSTTLEKNHLTKSPFAFWPSRCDIRVIRDASDPLDTWHTEKVNLLEDYMMFYDKQDLKKLTARAFVIMTDSDNTGTTAQGDYDNIYFSKD